MTREETIAKLRETPSTPTLDALYSLILDSIADIQDALTDQTEESLMADRPRRLFVERCYEVVSDSVRCLPEAVTANERGINWLRTAEVGDLLRREYYRTDVKRLLSIAAEDLPPLRTFVERVLDEEKKR